MVFQPSLDQDAADGFYNMVEGLLDDIFRFASLVPRVATHLEAQDYRTDLDEVHVYTCICVWVVVEHVQSMEVTDQTLSMGNFSAVVKHDIVFEFMTLTI